MAATQIQREAPPAYGNHDASQLNGPLGKLTLETDQNILQDPNATLTLSPETTQEWQSDDEVLDIITPTSTNASQSSAKSLTFKSAFEDVRHFAGGLVSHPFEASRHFSVLRHSHGLVYFKGFNTNVAISVFGDQPLPADRQFWLQKRGYSGKTGLKLGASMFGTKGAWINVTPATRARPDQLPPADERAWQRDIEKFGRKGGKAVRDHRPLETCILRVPCSAEDGYFRVVLCSGEKGKKTLCPSPIFRLVSTSTSMGSLRGASLSTMPLELGIKIGQFAARQVAVNAAAPMAGQAVQQAKNLVPWAPSGIVQDQALSVAQSNVQGRVAAAHEQSVQSEQAAIDRYIAHAKESVESAQLTGEESGPEAPYPIQFNAKLATPSGMEDLAFAMPIFDLNDVADDVMLRLSGTYFGWAKFSATKGSDLHPDVLDTYHQTILTVRPKHDNKASTVLKKSMSLTLATEIPIPTIPANTKASLILMGRIRSTPPQHDLSSPNDIYASAQSMIADIATTQVCLARPAWQPDAILERVRSDRSARSLNERYADARGAVQKGVDRVPVHYVGVRTDSMAVRDRLVGNGGVWVPR